MNGYWSVVNPRKFMIFIRNFAVFQKCSGFGRCYRSVWQRSRAEEACKHDVYPQFRNKTILSFVRTHYLTFKEVCVCVCVCVYVCVRVKFCNFKFTFQNPLLKTIYYQPILLLKTIISQKPLFEVICIEWFDATETQRLKPGLRRCSFAHIQIQVQMDQFLFDW